MANQEGTFTIPAASIVAEGDNKSSNTLTIKVLPPDKANAAATSGGTSTGRNQSNNNQAASASSGKVSNQDLFITATVNKSNVFEQEAILLTYKVYYLVNLRGLQINMPDLKGFDSQDVELKRWPTL